MIWWFVGIILRVVLKLKIFFFNLVLVFEWSLFVLIMRLVVIIMLFWLVKFRGLFVGLNLVIDLFGFKDFKYYLKW